MALMQRSAVAGLVLVSCLAALSHAQAPADSTPKIRSVNGGLDVDIGQADDVKFTRTKRETVSIVDLSAKAKAFDAKVAATIKAMEEQLKTTTAGAMAALATVAVGANKGSADAVKENLEVMQRDLDRAVGDMKKDVTAASASMDKQLQTLAVERKKETAEVAALDAKLKEMTGAKGKERACAAKGEIFNGKACGKAAGTSPQHPSETMTVECNKDYSVGPVCVLPKNFRANNIQAHKAAVYCAKQPHGRMCSSAEVQYMCQKGKFKGKSVRQMVWVRGSEGGDNREFPGVYVNSARCANDDFNRDDGSGTALCCRDKEINVGCQEKDKSGKDTGFRQVKSPGGVVIGCRGHQSASRIDPLQSQRICYDKNQRWGSSAETNLASFNGHKCPAYACWMDGGEGNDNQEFNGRNSNGVLDDWSYNSRLGTQCYVTYLPPIKTTECWANGGFASGSVCFIAWDVAQRFYFYDAAMGCATRGHRLCQSDEMSALQEHGVLKQALGHGSSWFDGGEGNDNQEESGWNHNDGRLEDWNSGRNGRGGTRLQYACCRTIGFFDGQSKDFTISQRGPV